MTQKKFIKGMMGTCFINQLRTQAKQQMVYRNGWYVLRIYTNFFLIFFTLFKMYDNMNSWINLYFILGVYIIITLLCLCINYDLAETRHDDKSNNLFFKISLKICKNLYTTYNVISFFSVISIFNVVKFKVTS